MKSQIKKKLTTGKTESKSAVTNGKPETNGKRKFTQISPQLNEEIQSDSDAEQEK